MKWTCVAVWSLAAAELLALGTVFIVGVDRIVGAAIHAALLLISLVVAVGVSYRTSAGQEADISPATSPPILEAHTADPLDNRPWIGLVEDCVQLLDEMDRDFEHAEPERKDLAEHVVLRLSEILERAGVEVIDGEATFDRTRHQAPKASPGMAVVATISPGYAVGRRVLRRAKVVVRPE